MARKPEYIVANGCLQEGGRVIREGEPYTPASAELARRLIAKGKLVEDRKGAARPEPSAEGDD